MAWLLWAALLTGTRCPLRARCAGHSPLVFHNEPDGVADIPVLLVGAELHLHAHALLLALNVLQRVLHQIAHRPVLPGVQGLDVLEDVKHLQDKTERLGDNIFI